MSDLNDAAGKTTVPTVAATATTWNGTGMTLAVNGSVNMPQTPNGTLVFGYFNLTTQNSPGELILTSGGAYYKDIAVPPLQSVPGIVMHNWQASNLNVSNVSANPTTSIYISAYGPGVLGQTPQTLTPGKPLSLGTTVSAVGATKPQNMRLKIQVSGAATGVFAIVGGPLDENGNNGKVIAVNFPQGTDKPDGYYAVTSDNSYVFSFNWNGSQVYVVNMSSTGSPLGQVTLQAV